MHTTCHTPQTQGLPRAPWPPCTLPFTHNPIAPIYQLQPRNAAVLGSQITYDCNSVSLPTAQCTGCLQHKFRESGKQNCSSAKVESQGNQKPCAARLDSTCRGGLGTERTVTLSRRGAKRRNQDTQALFCPPLLPHWDAQKLPNPTELIKHHNHPLY